MPIHLLFTHLFVLLWFSSPFHFPPFWEGGGDYLSPLCIYFPFPEFNPSLSLFRVENLFLPQQVLVYPVRVSQICCVIESCLLCYCSGMNIYHWVILLVKPPFLVLSHNGAGVNISHKASFVVPVPISSPFHL